MDSAFQQDHQQEQRHALTEDSVSYAIYLAPTTIPRNESDNGKEDQSSSKQERRMVTLEAVQIARTLISSIVAELSKDYIWHKDAFSLRIVSGKGESNQPYLKGETRFGDSLDDEWMVVFLLREITRRIPGTVTKVQDNDGEFLLIEAADYIPSWLDPDNSENRVFIHEGELHIIPIATTTEEKKSYPSTLGSKSKAPKLQDALDMVRQSQEQGYNTTHNQHPPGAFTTLASPKIQQAAFGPLQLSTADAPQSFGIKKSKEQRHVARCQIPVQVARILKARPELVTRACEAFYTRDAVAMAACSRMTKFLPPNPNPPGLNRSRMESTQFITTAVCFTKTCYAQLMGQQFQPPKSWDGIVPPPIPEDAADPQKVKEAELGMKLTCGFEILCNPDYPGDFGFKSGQEIKLEEFKFATDYGWRVFKNNLTMRKYFGDERLGSKRYQELEEIAQRQFLENKMAQLGEDTDGQEGMTVSYHGHGYHPVEEIDRILAEPVEGDVESLVDTRENDDDSWMDVDLQVLEDMMRARGFGGGVSMETEESAADTPGGLDMQQMLDRFGEFIQEGKGGVEGAEFLDEQSDDDGEDESDDGEDDSMEEKKDDEEEGQGDVEMDDSEDEDIFASDYEERVAIRQRGRKAKLGQQGVFTFDNGDAQNTSVAEAPKMDAIPTVTEQAKKLSPFVLDNNKVKDLLVRTFGVPPAGVSRKDTLAAGTNRGGDSDDDGEDEGDLSDSGLQEYMAELDAELSGTKVGQSFEKMTVPSTQPSSGKGKCSHRDQPAPPTKAKTKAAKPEKSLEEIIKEHAARSRRGYSRQGPLPTTSTSGGYGYDPAAAAFADHDDDDEEEEEEGAAQVTTLSSDEDDDEGDQVAVDVDLNLAKNLLESFKSQGGLPGPGGNLLSRLGIVLPRDEAEDEA